MENSICFCLSCVNLPCSFTSFVLVYAIIYLGFSVLIFFLFKLCLCIYNLPYSFTCSPVCISHLI